MNFDLIFDCIDKIDFWCKNKFLVQMSLYTLEQFWIWNILIDSTSSIAR